MGAIQAQAGALGKKVSGVPNWRGSGESDILQLCSRAPKSMTNGPRGDHLDTTLLITTVAMLGKVLQCNLLFQFAIKDPQNRICRLTLKGGLHVTFV